MFCLLNIPSFKNGAEVTPSRKKVVDTCFSHVARGVHFANEKLQADDGVDNDDEEYQQGDVKQGNHGFNDGV